MYIPISSFLHLQETVEIIICTGMGKTYVKFVEPKSLFLPF